MDSKQLEERVKIWKAKLKQLELQELPRAMARIGQSADTGDWSENAEFEDAERQVEFLRSRIGDIKKLINDLEKENKKNGNKN